LHLKFGLKFWAWFRVLGLVTRTLR